ncbi:MAG: peptide transporter [Planctomycetes bacterium]|nr:peptide transporter [Planctomycetota bacterium]
MANDALADRELREYRDLMKPPSQFRDGFGWTTIVGIIFCGVVMMPGSIYLGLMTGGGMGSAATWVTLILFNEIARRSLRTMSAQELVVLLRAAGLIMAGSALFPGGPFGGFVYRAYLVTSDAVRDAGLKDAFPSWFVPAADSPAVAARELFHIDWMVPIVLLVACWLCGFVARFTLGYFFFRVTSDMEKLPYPMAPVQAQGTMALAESDQKQPITSASLAAPRASAGGSTRWKQFSLGATIGLIFGAFQVGVPAVTGLFLDKPVFLLPQPFVDLTRLVEGVLPATPFGIALDLGVIMLGLVLPFWAVVGTFAAIVLTMALNPILHASGVLSSWQPGMDTINATFANEVDFWMSFNIGAGFAIAAISVWGTARDLRAKLREIRERRSVDGEPGGLAEMLATPPGRGDYPLWMALAGYGVSAAVMVLLSWSLLGFDPVILVFLIVFAFVYSPLISYVNARLLGISGQSVDIPFVRESAFMLSGSRGIGVWLAPVPMENLGGQAQAFRVNELTGVRMWSMVKTELIGVPILFVLSMVFWAFIWKANALPSPAFPAAEVGWSLQAKRDALLYSSTFVPPGQEQAPILDSQFMRAIHPRIVATGFVGATVGFVGLTAAGAPVLFVYGMIRGLGQLPHYLLLELVGALVARFYFERRFGRDVFRTMAPTLLAGYFTGVGLISMATIALMLIQQAVAGPGL